MRRRRTLHILLALLGAIVAFGLALGESVVVVRGDEWDTIENCNACLKAIAFGSPDDGWALGDGSVMLHYHNGRWSWADSPRDAQLSAITMLSPDDGWAVGYDAVILHYHDGRWQSAHDEVPPTDLNDISMATPDDGWAVGADWSHPGKDGGEYYGLLMHYSHGAWTTLPLLPHVDLAGVAMVSPDDGWAVGSRFEGNGTETGLILHYQAGQWTSVPSPADASFFAVAMRSPFDGWIVGDGVYLHYREGAWTQAAGPDDVQASGIALSGTDDGLTSGAALSADGHFTAAHLLRLTNGAWLDATPSLPITALTAVTVAPGGATWLLAEADNPPGFGGRHGLLLRGDAGGHWSPVEIPRKPLWLPLALLLPVSVVATATLCLAIVNGAVRVFRLRAAAKGAAARIIALLAFLLAILLALEVMQVAALVYPGSLIGLQPLLFAVVLAASLAPVLSLLVGVVSLVLRIQRALAAH